VPRWAHLPQPKTGRLFLYVDSYRQPAGEINKKAMIDHGLLYGSAWMGEKALLDIDLFIEYRLQMPVIAGFLVMRFLSGYTLVYTVF
jgi:hypothetical protein